MAVAILFDLDETLFDRTGSLREFLADQHERHSALSSCELGVLLDRFLKLDNRGRELKSVVYTTLLAELDVVDATLADHLVSEYEEHFWRFARPFEGLVEMLSQITARGLRTAVVTNGRSHIQLRSLLALNLDRSLDAYLISEAEGVRKPEAEIFLRAARKLGTTPQECVFVGDSPEADIIGAQQVGMKTIWFPNGAVWPSKEERRPDAEVSALIEIVSVLNEWG